MARHDSRAIFASALCKVTDRAPGALYTAYGSTIASAVAPANPYRHAS
jgi:hypothetical protein